MNHNRIKEALVLFRNGLAFSFSWMVFCTMVVFAFCNQESISILLLAKLLGLSAWAVICFIVCFKNLIFRNMGFILRLTLFYVMFIPMEVIGFYSMNIFMGSGKVKEWGVFGIMIMCLYIACVLFDLIVCRKQGESYTRSLLAYNERRLYEQTTGDGNEN